MMDHFTDERLQCLDGTVLSLARLNAVAVPLILLSPDLALSPGPVMQSGSSRSTHPPLHRSPCTGIADTTAGLLVGSGPTAAASCGSGCSGNLWLSFHPQPLELQLEEELK